jgi:hypothetical protein
VNASDASASSQSNQIDLLDVMAVRIRALDFQIKIGRMVDAAEDQSFRRLLVDDNQRVSPGMRLKSV